MFQDMNWSYLLKSFDLSLEKGETYSSRVVTKCIFFFYTQKIHIGSGDSFQQNRRCEVHK